MFAQLSPMSRRDVVGILGGITASTFKTFGLIEAFNAHQSVVEKISIPIRNLPEALIGTRFAQISDLHMGPDFKAEHLFPVIEKINALEPEFLMLTGDYVNDDKPLVNEMLVPLQALKMPAYGILGNHDGWGQEWAIQKVLNQTPVKLLWNRSIEVKPRLWLVGLDDVLCGRPNLPRALADAKPQDTKLLMVHEPDYFCKTVGAQVPVDAQFSGHTHGGQIRLPKLAQDANGSHIRPYVLPTMGKKYVMGYYQIGHQSLYVNRGLGFTGPPMRLNCKPEITLFSLTRAEH